jgi:hypothetical protein
MVRFVSFIVAVLLASGAEAAQFSVLCDGLTEKSAQGCTIKLSGPIEPGDADRLMWQLRQPLPEGWQYLTLLLSSPGGDVQEAFRLAKVVRQALLKTTTSRMSSTPGASAFADPHFMNDCVSACFLVWVSGTERSGPSSRRADGTPRGLGLHRPAFTPAAMAGKGAAEVAAMHQEMTVHVRDFLRREQIPEIYIQKMLEHSSREVYWLADSNDMFALDGRAAWFEELLIARCKYDPAYDRDSQAAGVARIDEAFKSGVRHDPTKDRGYQRWLTWKQEQNGCEYAMRIEAQAKLRVGLQPKQR